MKKLLLLAAVLAAPSALAFGNYPGLIPNGNVNSCSNCHISPQGAGPRTEFGEDVFANREGNTILWNQLFNLDSDGDGVTNGQELGDPCGQFPDGDFTAGSEVSLPGDADDTLADPQDNTCDGIEPSAPPEGGCSQSSGAPFAALALLLVGLAIRRRR